MYWAHLGHAVGGPTFDQPDVRPKVGTQGFSSLGDVSLFRLAFWPRSPTWSGASGRDLDNQHISVDFGPNLIRLGIILQVFGQVRASLTTRGPRDFGQHRPGCRMRQFGGRPPSLARLRPTLAGVRPSCGRLKLGPARPNVRRCAPLLFRKGVEVCSPADCPPDTPGSESFRSATKSVHGRHCGVHVHFRALWVLPLGANLAEIPPCLARAGPYSVWNAAALASKLSRMAGPSFGMRGSRKSAKKGNWPLGYGGSRCCFPGLAQNRNGGVPASDIPRHKTRPRAFS